MKTFLALLGIFWLSLGWGMAGVLLGKLCQARQRITELERNRIIRLDEPLTTKQAEQAKQRFLDAQRKGGGYPSAPTPSLFPKVPKGPAGGGLNRTESVPPPIISQSGPGDTPADYDG